MPVMSSHAVATEAKNGDHLVQLYEDENSLVSAIVPFLSTGLSRWEGVIAVTVPSHWDLFARNLQSQNIDVAAAIKQQQLVVQDAGKLLGSLLVDGMLDAARFRQQVVGLVQQMTARYPRVRIYGEMVNILWSTGRVSAAVRLEELWNDLIKTYPFSLFCSYRMDGFDSALYQGTLQAVCRTHSHAFPVEDSDRLEKAVDQALGEILGVSQAKTLRASVADQCSTANIPEAQALLFWLREQMPTMADAVLIRARQYYRKDLSVVPNA